jgi:hypothetical protein
MNNMFPTMRLMRRLCQGGLRVSRRGKPRGKAGGDRIMSRVVALEYAALADRVISVDTALSIRAFELGSASTKRLPLIVALIASAACLHDAILIHRDPHFGSIPTELLRQELLE